MQEKIKKALNGLKDFQRKTVDYVFDQLYVAGRSRILIADEVGLGKTIVAKGIIARAYERFHQGSAKSNTEARFNVIYVCSNAAIAQQNIRKLNFTENDEVIDANVDDDRITSLAYENKGEKLGQPISIRAFTPATSFDDKTHAGRYDERVLLYRLLFKYSQLNKYKNSLKWILRCSYRIEPETWEDKIGNAEAYENNVEWASGRPIRAKVRTEFREKLEEEAPFDRLPKSYAAAGLTYPVKYWTLLINLAARKFRYNTNPADLAFTRELVSHLRLTLSQVCLEFLNANIFILDEFQRYKRLIEDNPDDDSPATVLVKAIFATKQSKILMLSATPFKAYTNDFDEMNGQVHQKEFETVLKFINEGRNKAFWDNFEKLRTSHFSMLRHPKNLLENADKVLLVKSELEKIYRECMVRTERLAISEDRNALIQSMNADKRLELRTEDIEDFVGLDKITRHLNQNHDASLSKPIEYIKSSPFALSFLENYQHKKKLAAAVKTDPELEKLLQDTKHIWVDPEAVSKYSDLIGIIGNDFPNARLRTLADETIENGGWRLLWIPPTLPYYEFKPPYLGMEQYSKTLVFSSWVLVPRMISTMLSYEVERLAISAHNATANKDAEEAASYFAKRRTPRPQITFKVEGETFSQVRNILYTYPCISLARLYDPAVNITDKLNLEQIKQNLAENIKVILRSEKITQYCTADAGSEEKWYWAAPLLMDKISPDSELCSDWLADGSHWSDTIIDSENDSSQEVLGKDKYFAYIRQFYKNPKIFKLPRLTELQFEKVAYYLSELALGSPAVCYLRTLLRYTKPETGVLESACDVASGFITLFNKPENIATVRATTGSVFYLDKMLEYSIAGNIQAMLDEYVYLTLELEGLSDVSQVDIILTDALSVRTAGIDVDTLSSFLASARGEEKHSKKSIRTHFASDFGTKKFSTAKSSNRTINIRQAFNSPFRPFVLATTSIGQEGLDFHLYCRKIFHWNLPSNAIDIEQREGRINRYKGLVIRQNLAAKYRNELCESGDKNMWNQLFDIAQQKEGKGVGKHEIIPFWHTESHNGIKIERYVPLYPFSRDIARYKELLKVLVYYRLTFGHSRQEEIVEALAESCSEEDISQLNKLIINLSPIIFMQDSDKP